MSQEATLHDFIIICSFCVFGEVKASAHLIKCHNCILINDDVNMFEFVIDTLMKVCHHTREQAETCAWITHYKGKCAVMHGSFEELKPYYDILLGHQLTVKITD